MHKSLFFLLLLVAPGLIAQTKVNLGTQAQGQLPMANAMPVISAMPSLAAPAGAHNGTHAQNAYAEQWVADARCPAGSTTPNGFDYAVNVACTTPGSLQASTGTFEVDRTLSFGASSASFPPAATYTSISFTAPMGGTSQSGGNVYGGFQTCTAGSHTCDPSTQVGIVVNGNGVYLAQEGNFTLLWNQGSSSSGGAAGTTDSSIGLGWAAPSVGLPYTYTFMLPGNGTAIISVVPVGGSLNYTAGWFAVRVPVTMPSGSLHSAFLYGRTVDSVSDIAIADAYQMVGTLPGPQYVMAFGGGFHGVRVLRWALHSDGSECSYTAIAADCSNVYAVVPPTYKQDVANPWTLFLRGQEYSIISFDSTVAPITNYLSVNGQVEVLADWHGNTWYGAPRDLASIAQVQSWVRDTLTLADKPSVLADSAGGINALDAIAHGVLKPRVLICDSCNINLLSDAQGNNYANQQAGVTQMPYIETDYGFGDPSQYATYTAGYDPLLIVQNPTTAQGPLTGTAYPLLPYAAQLMASVPTLLLADQGCNDDQVVNQCINSTAYYAAINAMNPGAHSLLYIPGGHVSATKLAPATVLGWINTH